MKHRDLLVRYVAIVVVAVFAIGILLSGDSLNWDWLRFFAIATLLASGGLLLWEHLLWRLPWIQKLPKVPRCVRGTWRGDLVSHWVDPGTGQRIEPKVCYLVVRQTASTAGVVLMTDESKSRSSSAVLAYVDGEWTLAYMYLNRPGIAVEHRSRMHHGSTLLDLSGSPVRKLQGRYWTDRDSRGELSFDQNRSRLAEDYETAVTLFG